MYRIKEREERIEERSGGLGPVTGLQFSTLGDCPAEVGGRCFKCHNSEVGRGRVHKDRSHKTQVCVSAHKAWLLGWGGGGGWRAPFGFFHFLKSSPQKCHTDYKQDSLCSQTRLSRTRWRIHRDRGRNGGADQSPHAAPRRLLDPHRLRC